jgi:hypothetical protein
MATGKLAAVAIANFNPDKDSENRTLHIIQELIEVFDALQRPADGRGSERVQTGDTMLLPPPVAGAGPPL